MCINKNIFLLEFQVYQVTVESWRDGVRVYNIFVPSGHGELFSSHVALDILVKNTPQSWWWFYSELVQTITR